MDRNIALEKTKTRYVITAEHKKRPVAFKTPLFCQYLTSLNREMCNKPTDFKGQKRHFRSFQLQTAGLSVEDLAVELGVIQISGLGFQIQFVVQK